MDKSSSPIGGYFELELRRLGEYHPNAYAVNSGRCAFEHVLIAGNFQKIYIPIFTCTAIEDIVKKLGIAYEKYHVDEKLEPIFNLNYIGINEAFIYTNYFGMKTDFVGILASKSKNIIVDNSQAFYDAPHHVAGTFYSPRKFFGIPDGGYFYTSYNISNRLSPSYSWENLRHLGIRIDESTQAGFDLYQENELRIDKQAPGGMSLLSKRLLESIDYLGIKKIRLENFFRLDERLGCLNQFEVRLSGDSVPLCYPFLFEDKTLRERLLRKMVFCPIYWPNILSDNPKKSIEYFMAENLIHLPIDQRYSSKDMDRIVHLVLNEG